MTASFDPTQLDAYRKRREDKREALTNIQSGKMMHWEPNRDQRQATADLIQRTKTEIVVLERMITACEKLSAQGLQDEKPVATT